MDKCEYCQSNGSLWWVEKMREASRYAYEQGVLDERRRHEVPKYLIDPSKWRMIKGRDVGKNG